MRLENVHSRKKKLKRDSLIGQLNLDKLGFFGLLMTGERNTSAAALGSLLTFKFNQKNYDDCTKEIFQKLTHVALQNFPASIKVSK